MKQRSPRLLVVALGLALLATAAWNLLAALPESAPAPARYREGEVIAVDPADSRIVLRAGLGWRSKELVIPVKPGETRISWRGTPVQLGDVHQGDHATVRFSAPQSAGDPMGPAAQIWIARAEGPVTR